MFEEEYKKIIEQLKENEDYAVMRVICENIVDLLEENGIKLQGTIYKKGGFVVSDNTLRDIGAVYFSGLDLTEHDRILESKFKQIINEQKKQISELSAELEKKEALLKMREELCEECKEKMAIEKLKSTPLIEEPLPFSSDEYEEDFLEKLRSRELNFNLASKMLDVIELMLTNTQS